MIVWSGELGQALDVLIDHRGKTPKKLGGDWTDHGIPVYSAIHVKNGRLEAGGARAVSQPLFEKWMPIKLRAGDVLLTSEAPLGEVALIRDDRPACLGQRLFGLRGRHGVLDGRYLYYLLQHAPLRAQILGRASGTTVSGIRQAELVKVRLDLPEVMEQRAIAGVLGALDDKIESNRRLAEVVDQLVRAEVVAACADGDAGTVEDLVSNVRFTINPDGADRDTRYVGLEHMPRGHIILDSWGTTEGLGSAKSGFANGDILFGKLRPYFKKVALALPAGGICSTDILVLRPKVRDLTAVALAMLASDDFIDFASNAASGTRMPRASWDHMKTFPVLIPPLEDLQRLANLLHPLLAAAQRAVEESVVLAELRDAILPELLSGRLQVPMAEELVESVT